MVCVGFSTRKWYVVFFSFFCSFILNHCVCRRHTTLQIGDTHEYTVRRQICCLSRASGVIVVPLWSQWCADWCALGCSAAVAFGCVFLSHISGWLTLVEVFAVVPTWSVLLSVVSGREKLRGPLERWGAGRLFHRGTRRRVTRARLVFWRSGASGMGANAVDFFWCFENKRAPFLHENSQLTLKLSQSWSSNPQSAYNSAHIQSTA